MWRSRLMVPNCKFFTKSHKNKLFSSFPKENSKNLTFKILTSSGLAFVGAVVYVMREPKLKHYAEENIPYVDRINKLFLNGSAKKSKIDEIYFSEKLLNNRSKGKDNNTSNGQSEDNKHTDEKIIQLRDTENTLKPPEIEKHIASSLEETILKLKKNLEEAVSAYRLAANAIKFCDVQLNEILENSDNAENLQKEANNAEIAKDKILIFARIKIIEVKTGFLNLKSTAKQLLELGVFYPSAENAENLASKCLLEFEKAEDKLKTTNEEAKEVSECKKILEVSKELFEKQLGTILPKEFSVDKHNLVDNLNLLIINATNRIEQLQKEVVSLQEAEKIKNNKSVIDQQMLDDLISDAEKQEYFSEFKNILEKLFALMKADFEVEMHQLLVRQLSAHADHLQKSLEFQEQELTKRYKLELEEIMLNNKDALVIETKQNSDRLQGIVEYLKTMNELKKSTKIFQNLWLICQAMSHKITTENLTPFANDIDKIKMMFDEDNFVSTIVAGVPDVALNRGIYTVEILKQRFEKVKHNCMKVALIDTKNDSLYRYFLSYLQSLLLIDVVSAPAIDDNDHAVTSKLDTHDILQRIAYFLKTGDLEQSLRYANQLQGEPRVVAEDWMKELTYLLETQLALKALIAYAAATNVQAYH